MNAEHWYVSFTFVFYAVSVMRLLCSILLTEIHDIVFEMYKFNLIKALERMMLLSMMTLNYLFPFIVKGTLQKNDGTQRITKIWQ